MNEAVKQKQSHTSVKLQNVSDQKNNFVNGVVNHNTSSGNNNKKNKKRKHKSSTKSVENIAESNEKCTGSSLDGSRILENTDNVKISSNGTDLQTLKCDNSVNNVEESLEAKNHDEKSNETVAQTSQSIDSKKHDAEPVVSGGPVNSNDDSAKLLDVTEELDKLEIKCNVQQLCPQIEFVEYKNELQMPTIMKIIQKDLSEPYSIYTYRYFIHNWPNLCYLAMCGTECVGAIVCKLDIHRKAIRRGYIAMLAVDQNYRKMRIGSTLVQMAIQEMIAGGADEIVLETEVTNKPALQLYEKLGFVRDKRLFRYYLNGVDALRLKLWLR